MPGHLPAPQSPPVHLGGGTDFKLTPTLLCWHCTALHCSLPAFLWEGANSPGPVTGGEEGEKGEGEGEEDESEEDEDEEDEDEGEEG